MKDWIVRGLKAVLALSVSRKVIVALVAGALAHLIGVDKATEIAGLIVTAVAVILGIAIEDHGAKMQLPPPVSPSLKPAVMFPSPSGGVPQVADPENPKP